MDAKTPQADSHKAVASTLPFSRSIRRVVLLALLVIVAAVGLCLRGGDLRTWWLARRNLDELRIQAQRSSHDPLVWYLYGQKLLRAGQADAATNAFQQAAQALPSGASDALAENINANFGYLLARQGQLQEATTCLDYARKLNDENPLVAVGYGILFAQQQKYAYAITQFRLAATLDPRNAEAWFRLGSALNADNQNKEALDPLHHAIALVPNDAASHAELGHALTAQNQSAEALGEYRRAHDLAPDNAAYAALAGTALAQSARTPADYQEAARLLEQAYKQHPDDASLANGLGSLHLRFNAPRVALPYLERSVNLAPREAEGWYNLARAHQLLGHAAAASQAQKRFQTLRQLTTDLSVAVKRIAVAPSDAEARIRMARLYLQQGNLEAARAQYTIALSLQSSNVEARQAVTDLRRRITQQGASAPGNAPVSLGPPPPPGLQIFDPEHELPSFHAETGNPPPVSPK